MNKFVQYLLIAFLLSIGGNIEAQAATQRASSCSNSAIQSAINSASDGDTVSVPAGNCTWSGSVIIPSSKGITLQGEGTVTGTPVTGNGSYSQSGTFINIGTNRLIVQTRPSGNSPVRITGFYFTHTYSYPPIPAIHMQGETGAFREGSKNWRIDHNYFKYIPNPNDLNAAVPAVEVDGWTFGLIDHNVLYHQGRCFQIEARNDTWEPVYGVDFAGDGSWDTKRGGPLDWGANLQSGHQYPYAVYIEDNWAYGNQQINSNQFIDDSAGSRIVMRYNRIEDLEIMSHSGSSNHGRSTLHQEIYNNAFISNNSGVVTYAAIFLRGGTFVFFNNTITGNYALSNPLIVDYPAGSGCSFINPPSKYISGCSVPICVDQIGTGPDSTYSGKTAMPAYSWSNYQNGNLVNIVTGQCGYNVTRSGIDFINNETTPKPGYTPYTYPHPLSIGGVPSPVPPSPKLHIIP